MRKKLFLLSVIGALLFSFTAFASNENRADLFERQRLPGEVVAAEDEFVGGFGFDETELAEPSENDLAPISLKELISGDEKPGINFTEKSVAAPTAPAFPVAPYHNSIVYGAITEQGKTRAATGPGSSPNTAPEFPVNSGYYPGKLTGTGDQHWFYTQADRNGQLTVHLDVPNNSAIDYDLNVYRYEMSTGNLYTFISSQRGPSASEHVTFNASKDAIYFIHIQSYQGGSTTAPYYLHVEMATPDFGEIDDYPDGARAVQPNTGEIAAGILTMRCDEDFIKFTATGNKSLVQVGLPTDANTFASVYVLSGTSLIYQGDIVEGGEYMMPTTAGNTYYLHFYHANNKAPRSGSYQVRVNSFTCSETIAKVLGFDANHRRIAYVTNSDRLYVDSSMVLDRLAQSCSYHYEKTTNYKMVKHDSYSVSPVMSVHFVSYSTTRSDVDSISDALALYIGKTNDNLGVHFENRMSRSYGAPGGGWEPTFQNGYASGYYIVDMADRKVKDFASGGNGFYAPYNFFEEGDWYTMTEH